MLLAILFLYSIYCKNNYNYSSHVGNAIWCYRCTSATPGCAENFHWRGIGFWGEPCPEDNDICVKVIERKGGIQFYSKKKIYNLICVRIEGTRRVLLLLNTESAIEIKPKCGTNDSFGPHFFALVTYSPFYYQFNSEIWESSFFNCIIFLTFGHFTKF